MNEYKPTLCPVCKTELSPYTCRERKYQEYNKSFPTVERYCKECKEWREIE